MDMSMIYIGVVMVILALGFVFALRLGISAALEADRAWPVEARTASEPSVIEAAAPTKAPSMPAMPSMPAVAVEG